MKKLAYPFVEIEVPEDFPDPADFEAVFKYGLDHPDVAARVCQEYRTAYRKLTDRRKRQHGQKAHQSAEAET
jgi:hypothetical protein